MTNPPNHEAVTEHIDEKEVLTEHTLLELLDTPGACLPFDDCELEDDGMPQTISLVGHPVYIPDIFDPEKFNEHVKKSENVSSGELSIVMMQYWRWEFERGAPDFRMSARSEGFIVKENGDLIPSRLICKTYIVDGVEENFHFLALDK